MTAGKTLINPAVLGARKCHESPLQAFSFPKPQAPNPASFALSAVFSALSSVIVCLNRAITLSGDSGPARATALLSRTCLEACCTPSYRRHQFGAGTHPFHAIIALRSRRQAAGGLPTVRLKARANAASES